MGIPPESGELSYTASIGMGVYDAKGPCDRENLYSASMSVTSLRISKMSRHFTVDCEPSVRMDWCGLVHCMEIGCECSTDT
jgi:hypothetical protein